VHEYKKYPNRRLYDLDDSKYVTVEDVRNVIISGESITVVDSRDDTDITRSVLMQILSEQESEEHEAILTNKVIEQLIRLYGDAFGAVASRYFEQSMLKFLEYQDQYQSQMRRMQESNPFMSFMDPFNKDPFNKDPFNKEKDPS
jgi:polyhydroxyalkanoate synthesis repressor PhaR